MRTLLLAILLFTQSANADEWRVTDKILLSTYIGMQVTDVMQTRKALALGGTEMNPLLGRNPTTLKLIALKSISTGFIYSIADHYVEQRRPLLVAVNALQFIVVRHNYVQIGVGFGF